MRTIKFRAWDVVKKEMCYEGHIDVSPTWILHNRLYHPYGDLYHLMQFTGLLDKNGVEIYEGDIVVALSAGSKGTFEIKWRQEGSPCYILYPAWQNGTMWHISATEYKKGKQFIDVAGNITTCEYDAFVDDGLEVIGNIYQHPNLIK